VDSYRHWTSKNILHTGRIDFIEVFSYIAHEHIRVEVPGWRRSPGSLVVPLGLLYQHFHNNLLFIKPLKRFEPWTTSTAHPLLEEVVNFCMVKSFASLLEGVCGQRVGSIGKISITSLTQNSLNDLWHLTHSCHLCNPPIQDE
jgi:hypothetical protein